MIIYITDSSVATIYAFLNRTCVMERMTAVTGLMKHRRSALISTATLCADFTVTTTDAYLGKDSHVCGLHQLTIL